MNSNAKGKRGELAFVKVLKSLGFDARRGVQYQGGPDSPDIVCGDLPGIHFEVKHGDYVRMGNQPWRDAWRQVCCESKARRPVLAWHRTGERMWWLTYMDDDAFIVTTQATKAALKRLNGERK